MRLTRKVTVLILIFSNVIGFSQSQGLASPPPPAKPAGASPSTHLRCWWVDSPPLAADLGPGLALVMSEANTFYLASAAARLSFSEQIKLAIEGRDFMLQRDYAKAEGLLKGIVSQWPDDLLGYLGLMSLYQIRNLDNFDFRFDVAYRPWEEKGRRMALDIVRDSQEGQVSPWDLLLAGAILGVSGFDRAHHSRWVAALRDGSTGVHNQERAYKKDAKRTEALLGMGLYDYWRSYFTRKIRFLPLFPDRREKGRAEIEQAMRESDFVSPLAEIALAFMSFQEKNYGQTLETVDKLLQRYPFNTVLKMLRGKALIELGRYPEAIHDFESILAQDPDVTKSYFFLGMAYARQGKEEERKKAEGMLKKFLEREPGVSRHWQRQAAETLKTLYIPR